MFQIAELSRSKEAVKDKALRALSDAGVSCPIENGSDKVKIVFAGQYSAGKSSIIKMLTGDETIATGAKITTQETHTYEWNGLEIVDTPGVHTSLRPDHDEISYKAIAAADILVFVITNELFDSYMADHFRRLAIDKDKAGEMILVVNKMDRAAKGNTKEQQDIIREDLRDVLAPYTPEQLHLSFIDAQSYLDSVEEREGDPELADELLARSGYNEFIETLNSFVAEKTLSAKLTTDLYVLDNELDKAISDLTPGSEDSDIDALEENLKQQRHMLIDARTRIQRDVQDIFSDSAAKIREIGLDAAALVDSNITKEDLEEKIALYGKTAEELIESTRTKADDHVHSCFLELGQSFVDMESTEFSQNLKIRLVDKYDSLPDAVKKVFVTATDLEKKGDILVGTLVKSGIPEMLSLADSSYKAIRLTDNTQNFLRTSLHSMNTGTKLLNKAGKAGSVASKVANKSSSIFGVVGVGLELVLQFKEDYDEQLKLEAMKNNRQNIRSEFNTAATELDDYATDYIKQCVTDPMDQSVKSVEDNISELRSTRADRSEMCQKLEKIQKEVQALIERIHGAA
ncbi:small GTP-binding protein [Ruminococcaceae bacterium R-25]|nr:small GTP-binding protein [Ruminococcaceae bacterium R-25]SUQ22172.1 small GTP-binding protein domain-containing protein [Oscillospiraceae bacterium]